MNFAESEMRSKTVSNQLSISSRKPVHPQSIITVFFWAFFYPFARKTRWRHCYGCV